MHKGQGLAGVLALAGVLSGCGGAGEPWPKRPLLSEMTKDHAAEGAPGAAALPNADATHAMILGPEKSAVSFERMIKMPEPGWNIPRLIKPSPDGKLVTYLASESGDMTMSLFAFDLDKRTSRVLLRASDLPGSGKPLSREEELRRERQRQRAMGIVGYQWAEKAPVMLVPAAGDVFVRAADGKLSRLTETQEPELDPQLCATGERVAYVRSDDLWVVDVATRKETRLTTGGPKGTTRGQSDFLGQEELDEPHGFFWSPGCDKIVYLEVDERDVPEHPVLGYRGEAPDLMMQKYPEVGEKNPKVRAGIVDLKTKKTTWLKWPAEAERYMARFRWAPDGNALYLQTLDRLQKRRALVRVDAKSGEAKELFAETSPTWIEFIDYHLLEKSPRFVWPHDVGGHIHLELRDATTGASIKPLTSGDWDVHALGRVDEAAGRVFFIGDGKDTPLDRHLYSVPLEGGAPKRWTEEPGVHWAAVDRGAKFVMDIHSAMDRTPKVVLRELGGPVLADLTLPMDPDFASLGVRSPEIVSVDGPGGVKLYGALLPPRVIEPGKKHPVVVMVYGGPGVQTVLNMWSARLLWQHLADRGFAVFQLDNRGTAGRGPAFEAPLYKNVGNVDLADQIAGIDAIAKRPYIDASRVGIHGHSYGGYMAALALLKAPDRFHVGVAGSLVTDWRLYDSAYTERYLGSVKDDEKSYDAADLTKLAGNLRGKLFLMHALMDENVHFQNTAELIDALVAANKRFDLLVFPGERHGYRAPAARLYATQRTVEYFVENLR
ncbi:S9 family peptidase [Polyangium spumosum]|uniref:Alpha/beta fold hydrolase n=1 Tax=Polyangium spumosum TaxID=889282 RepID=A0A6N7PIE6_9BACT|nr:S9 family peptidase [Polyangium spumosum]MRG91892.1 alpha/beta fold hydrolase [Polyangium spumosum]